MKERSEMVTWMRGEIIGPSRQLRETVLIEFKDKKFVDLVPLRQGQLVWCPGPDAVAEEVLYFERESPHRKYGAGLLHPQATAFAEATPEQNAAQATDTVGAEADQDEPPGVASADVEEAGSEQGIEGGSLSSSDDSEEFEVTSPDVRRPSTIGVSLCARFDARGHLVVRLPQTRRFEWQEKNEGPFGLNGIYEECVRQWTDDKGTPRNAPVWRRRPALNSDCSVTFSRSEMVSGRKIVKPVTMPEGSPLSLRVDVFPRHQSREDIWIITVVLRNVTQGGNPRQSVLYQTYFEVGVEGGNLHKYPESQRPFGQLDAEEQSLALLYRESATWGIGHGCAAGWGVGPNEAPKTIYADVMPAVQLPSMTPEIKDARGNKIQLSMRALSSLPENGQGDAWDALENLAAEYSAWINRCRNEANTLVSNFAKVSGQHLDKCEDCLRRIKRGIALLRNPSDSKARKAFRLANLAMLLQQISTKQLHRRPLERTAATPWVRPSGAHSSPWSIYEAGQEDTGRLGSWRAFQIAFLLMSLEGLCNGRCPDREIVDLIWFPTGGGKTEAYLAAMAFYMFHERLLMGRDGPDLRRDGTNVLMRYTLRMLTTQQFQRAASLICAMEYMRRNPSTPGIGTILGERFSLGLWIGGDGSPNKIESARIEVSAFRRGKAAGNPLVLTECPWCRAEIDRYEGSLPNAIRGNQESVVRTRGISEVAAEGPLLHCTDIACSFGREHWQDWLPVEVIDERIYSTRPSLVIATADKLAIIAYRPDARALFGRSSMGSTWRQTHLPPGLIIQDELHLISGPLGTMYALYEGIFERLCSVQQDGVWVKPKLIASTATIRGAADQVRSIYARERTALFPSPGLTMGDSFFGKYARSEEGTLLDGRLYLGIHASDYGSVLTTQVRAFSSALFRPFSFAPDRRDPWWTLLAFYNSLRELGGAKTLFDSDIRSRLKFMFNREGFPPKDRRHLRIVEELTSRLSQAEIVGMMDKLSSTYTPSASDILDSCLASNIIEVGVDIDRLSLMGVVGQPKTTATYIQVTGRVGRRWSERPGLILMIYNPSKSRDRSHFEQFHSYHRRLYERVEPTSATPFAISAVQRGVPGALIAWARQHSNADVRDESAYADAVESGYQLLRRRCLAVQTPEDQSRSLQELDRMRDELERRWGLNPQEWEKFPPDADGEYLMLWPGQYATLAQKQRGFVVPSSMRQVDGNGELEITQGYVPTDSTTADTVASPPITP